MSQRSPFARPQPPPPPHRWDRRVKAKVLVFAVLVVHVVLLTVLLIQGCKHSEPPTAEFAMARTNAVGLAHAVVPAISVAPTNPPLTMPPVMMPGSNAPALAVPRVPAQPVTTNDYRVAKGDTLARIAKRSGVPLSELVAANPGVDPRRLQVGQVLKIPDKMGQLTASEIPPVSPPAGELIYTVKSGDTLTSIARTNRTTVEVIHRLNRLTDDRLAIGQKLKLPTRTAGAVLGAAATQGSPPLNATRSP